MNEIDSLAAEAQRAIDLLQERRNALISAAVTGKIDVRGLAERGGRISTTPDTIQIFPPDGAPQVIRDAQPG